MDKEQTLQKLDKQIEENISMLGGRNAEFLDTMLSIREKYVEQYMGTKEGAEEDFLIDNEYVLPNSMKKMCMSYDKYENAHDEVESKKQLKEFMTCVHEHFTSISNMTEDKYDERAMIRDFVKEIFSLFK